jgi:hypothetical protein
MALHLSKFVGILTILMTCSQLACAKLTNSNDDLPLQCGQDTKASSMYWKIENSEKNDFEAVIYRDGKSKEALKTSYGCIELPADIAPGNSLLVRSSTSRKGAVIPIDKHLRPGSVKHIALTETEEFQNQTIIIQCQAERVITGNQLFMKRSTQEAPKPVYNINRYTLRDERNQFIRDGLLPPSATFLALGANIPEGQYQLRTETSDAFSTTDLPRVSECLVSVDLTPPSVRLLVAGQETSLLENDELRVSPGQELKFSGIDKTPTQIFACLRKRKTETQPESCDQSDFFPINIVTAPEEGIWDLYFFATDTLGQQSPSRSRAIVVYHEDRVNEVNILAKLSRLSSAAFDQLSAWVALMDAERVLRRLSLKRERENTRWGFIGAFWELNKILKARWQKTFDFDGVDIKTSKNSRYWVATGFRQRLYIFEDEELKTELDNVDDFEVRGHRSIWTYSYTIGQGGEIRYYEGTALKLSWAVTGENLYVSESGQTAAMAEHLNSIKIFNPTNPLVAIRTRAFPRGEILFANADRLMFHKTDKRVTRVDLLDNNKELFYDVPSVCKIIGIATRNDRELYVLSRKSSPESPPPQDDDAPCGIYRIDFDSESEPQSVGVVPETGKYKADQFIFSTESEQRFLMFGNRWSSKVYAFDLTKPDANVIEIDLARGEAFSSVKPLSIYNPLFLLETTQSRYVLDFSNETMQKANFGPRTDICEVLPIQERLLCSSEDKNKVVSYETNPDRQLVPDFSLKIEDSEIVPATSRKGIAQLTANVQKKTLKFYRNEQPPKEFQLKESPKALAVSDSGNFAAVATENGNLIIYSPDGALAEAQLDGSVDIINLKISDRGDVFVLLSDGSDNKLFEIWNYQHQKLQRTGKRHNDMNKYYDTVILSPNGEYALVYAVLGKMDFLVNRPFSLFDKSSRFMKDLEANNSQPTFSRDSKGLYLARKQNVDFYSIEENQETPIAQGLAFEPYQIIEGDILIGTTLYKSYNLKTGETVGDGGEITVIQENYLAMLTATEGDVEIYSPNGKELILSYRPNEKLDTLIPVGIKGHPESPYFQVDMWIAGDNSHITSVTRTYVTDSFKAQEWLNRWPLP